MAMAGVLIGAAPAGATVTGPCDGKAEWTDGLSVIASELRPGEVVEIPQKATVEWTGSIALDPPPDGPRDVSGWVKVKLPFPIGQVTVGDWSDSGTLVESTGTYEYDLPSLVAGFEVPVTAKHWEGNRTFAGAATCEGDVTVKLAGTNPLGFITGGLTLISIAGVYLAVRATGPSAGGSA
jgi:hypothetical protein